MLQIIVYLRIHYTNAIISNTSLMKTKHYSFATLLAGLLTSGTILATGLFHMQKTPDFPNFPVLPEHAETSISPASEEIRTLSSPSPTIISTNPEVIVTTSLCSSWENLGAVNDGQVGSNSTTRPAGGIYGNWDSPNTYNWVMYEFPDKVIITEAAVYWFTDNGGLLFPTDAYIECYDEESKSFVKQGNIGTAGNKFNTLAIGNVLSKKIRISMINPRQSTGIVEFRIKGILPEKTPFASFGSSVDEGEWQEGTNFQTLEEGQSVSFAVHIEEADYSPGTWEWTGPNDFTSSDSLLTLSSIDCTSTGTYTVTFTNLSMGTTQQKFNLTVYDGEAGAEYTWKKYTPTLDYDFRQEYPDLPEPTKDLQEFPVAGRISDGWWTYAWGAKAKYLATDKVGEQGIRNMLARMNKDFKYFRETMGWPPDLRARQGYRSTIYLYGSGLPTDNVDSTALGGWQSATTYNGVTYPMVLLSYYPVYSFHPKCTYADRDGQMGAVVHEGIHALLADLPGCKGSAWIQEGGNTWLQQEYESRVSGNYSEMGFLNAAALIAPFMPIECYSGWLLDGSFGGPAAEGVNRFEGSQQICTWRNLLGGTQYGNLFVVYLGQTLGDRVVPWIWRNCSNRVLEGMADSLGSDQMRRLITEYRAKQAMLDFDKWTNATKKLLNANFNGTCQQEWEPYWIKVDPWKMTPYTKCTMDGNTVIPEERTLPGWSGANQVPLHVAKTDTVVTVDFQPIGENMTLQLCYRTKSGKIVYSTPVQQGRCVLKIPKSAAQRPANHVVIAVVSNTDYTYKGEETRKAKFDYRIKLVEGAYYPANPYLKWYEYTQTIQDITLAIEEVYDTPESGFTLTPTLTQPGKEVQVSFNRKPSAPTPVKLYSIHGEVLLETTLPASGLITLPTYLNKGIYLFTVQGNGKSETAKLTIQ